MTVLDAFAVLAFLKAEPASNKVETLIRNDPSCALTAIGVAEVIDHLVRIVGVDEDNAALDVAQLGLAMPHAVDAEIATRAAMIRARHYHRRTCAVSLADTIALETARQNNAALATSDPHLLDVCAAESVKLIALPDTNGTVWKPNQPR